MTTATIERSSTSYGDTSKWLYRLLADIRSETASEPSPQAVSRIRGRLLDAMKTVTKAAA